ncbi:uncharacterized protein LOC144863061 [Branchiostoma floridae x Branchiostoma japonicum]
MSASPDSSKLLPRNRSTDGPTKYAWAPRCDHESNHQGEDQNDDQSDPTHDQYDQHDHQREMSPWPESGNLVPRHRSAYGPTKIAWTSRCDDQSDPAQQRNDQADQGEMSSWPESGKLPARDRSAYGPTKIAWASRCHDQSDPAQQRNHQREMTSSRNGGKLLPRDRSAHGPTEIAWASRCHDQSDPAQQRNHQGEMSSWPENGKLLPRDRSAHGPTKMAWASRCDDQSYDQSNYHNDPIPQSERQREMSSSSNSEKLLPRNKSDHGPTKMVRPPRYDDSLLPPGDLPEQTRSRRQKPKQKTLTAAGSTPSDKGQITVTNSSYV